jgi:acyl-CoA reductase-like NAD-dependent aldehyde dehydrogenase
MSTGTRILTGHETSLYIDGSWSVPSDGRLVDVINPTTEEAIGQAAMAGPADIDRAVRAARRAFDSGPWAAATPSERAAVMTRAGELISERASQFAQTIMLDLGSPVAIANWQPLAAKLYVDWYAGQAATFPWEEEREGIRSGNVAINQHTLDPAGPFGGFKQSGLGRENGTEGIDAYVEVQCIPYMR